MDFKDMTLTLTIDHEITNNLVAIFLQKVMTLIDMKVARQMDGMAEG